MSLYRIPVLRERTQLLASQIRPLLSNDQSLVVTRSYKLWRETVIDFKNQQLIAVALRFWTESESRYCDKIVRPLHNHPPNSYCSLAKLSIMGLITKSMGRKLARFRFRLNFDRFSWAIERIHAHAIVLIVETEKLGFNTRLTCPRHDHIFGLLSLSFSLALSLSLLAAGLLHAVRGRRSFWTDSSGSFQTL